MQKWYEGGYFTPDLLMKRTHTDNEWIPVGELARRVGGGKIFLSPSVASAAPPGLSRQPEPPLHGFSISHDQHAYNAPVPTHSLRTLTLDSYVGSTSNPSDSPSSSFGAGRFSNGSPDPAAFGGRMSGNLYATDPAIGTRTPGFAAPGPSFASGRGAFNEPSLDQSLGVRAGGFGSITPGRAPSVDNYSLNGGYTPNQTPWQSNSVHPTGSGIDSMGSGLTSEPIVTFSSTFDATRPGFDFGSSTYLNQPGGLNNERGPQVMYGDNTTGSASSVLNGYNVAGAPTTQTHMARTVADDNPTQSEGFGIHANGPGNVTFKLGGQNQQTYSQLPLQYATASQQPAIALQTDTLPTSNQSTNAAPQSPWATVEPVPTRRLGPFDATHPKATNTIIKQTVISSQPSSPWGPTGATSPQPSQTNEASPWYAASQGCATSDGWRETPGPNSLTFDNVGAHNQLHQTPASDAPEPVTETPADPQLPSPTEFPAKPVAEHVPSVGPAISLPPSVPKSKRKPSTQQNQTVAPNLKTQPPMTSVVKDSPPPAQSKPAWSTDEDTKKLKPSSTGLGLREIQETEAKKSEARKAAERERATRAPTSPTIEDTQPFTASWGLPTSRVGARIDISPKEGPTAISSSSPVLNVPVWTNAGKPQQTKRTMKEIQEEEERRKKMANKETTAAAAARRGYVDSTNKVSVSVKKKNWAVNFSYSGRRVLLRVNQVVHG